MTNIATIISFCTNDLRFLHRCIQGARLFSSQIIIPVCDHFYNGKPEDLELLERIYAKYPELDFIQFAYSTEEVYGTPSKLIERSPGWARHWHNSARLIGTYFLQSSITHILFLDVDEIFVEDFNVADFAAIRFATYWYFKTATNVATVYPRGPLLIKRSEVTTELLLHEDEREGILQGIKGKKIGDYSLNGKPIVHHYSWVRPREEILLKVGSWGHHWERNWENLVDRPDDFVRGYKYKNIDAYWDPLQEKIELSLTRRKAKIRVTPKEIARMELEQLIQF